MLAETVFNAYDIDATGSLDRDEFTNLMLNLDGEITRNSVSTSLASTVTLLSSEV